MKHFSAMVLGLLLNGGLWAGDDGIRTFDLPQGITVSIPDGWVLIGENQLRAYERKRDALVGDYASATGAQAHVPFQALKRTSQSSTGAMMTVMPGEATQDEIAQWAEEDGRIEELGRLLGQAQNQGLAAAGATDIQIGPAELLDLIIQQRYSLSWWRILFGWLAAW